ncbi:hypothetical protein [Streptomyces sp. NPDC007856]|uniref:hypothetical protein n=1 Tax=Streptomyces sp. NPDC007856 TaxID=3364781 RepID=UPI0036B72417
MGLRLDAVAAYGFQQYLTEKQTLEETDDPIADLRRSWYLHVGFGLSRPGCYVLTYGEGRHRGDFPAGWRPLRYCAGTSPGWPPPAGFA